MKENIIAGGNESGPKTTLLLFLKTISKTVIEPRKQQQQKHVELNIKVHIIKLWTNNLLWLVFKRKN